jgi:hypothetical protein
MAKSTPIPLEEEACCTSDVFVASHVVSGTDCCGAGSEILGIFATEKEAKRCAAAAKKDDGYKGKEAKLHSYTVEPWAVSDKFEG